MPKQEKIDEVSKIKELFEKNNGLIFTDHSGLKAGDAVIVRDKLVGMDSYLRIIKNTLALIAARDVFGDIKFDEILNGPTSVVVCQKDFAATAKAIAGFSKKLEALKIKAAIMDGIFLDSAKVKRIADLPSREVLLANLARTVNAPIYQLVNILGGFPRNLVLALNAVKEKKEIN